MADHVHNELSGATIYGSVVQAGSIDSLTLVTPGVSAVPVDMAARDPRPVFSNALTSGFTGRERLIGRIDDFLAGSPCGYVWVEADAGMGKTALVAHLARERDWICHFSRYTEGRSIRAGLQNLAAQLVTRHELWDLTPGRLLPDWMCTPAGFERLLAEAADQGDKIVLLVDGADEADTEPGAQPWGLPTQLPAGVFVVGTYRTGSPPARCEAPRAALRVSAQDEDNLHDMRTHLREHAPAGVHVEELAARCGGVWVYLRYVLDEIRLGLRRPDDIGDLPGDLRSFYLAQLDRWRDDDHWQDAVLPIVSTLAAAEEALPLDMLASMSGADQRIVEQWCLGRLRPFLTAVPTTPRRFEIYHASLREVLTAATPAETEEGQAWSDILGPAVIAADNRIADYCLTSTDRYALRHLPRHLLLADRPGELDALLGREDSGKPVWFTAHENEDSLDWYGLHLDSAHAHHLARTDVALANNDVAPSLSWELHYLMMIASVNSLAQTISVELLCALAATGVWSPQRTVNHARRMPTPYDYAATLAAVLPHLPQERQPEVLAEALSVVDTIDDDQYRFAVLTDLAPHLTGEQLEHLLAATLAMPDGTARVSALTKLAPHLSEEQRRTLPAAATLTDHEVAHLFDALPFGSNALSVLPEFTETLTVTARISLIGKLAAYFPEPDRSRWLDTALAEIDDGDHGLDVKLELAPHLSATQVAELRSAVDSVEDEPYRFSLLTRLVPFLPSDQRTATATLVKDALAGPDQWIDRAKILPSLASYLSSEEVAEAFADTIRLAGVPDWHLRTTSPMVELAPHLPADLRALAVSTATSLPERHERVQTLVELAQNLPTLRERRSVVSAALAVATEIGHGENWDAITAALIPHLPDEERRAVLAQPMSIRVVQAATPYLSAAELERLLAEADPDVLGALARHAEPALLSRILDAVGQMHSGFHQEFVLGELAPRLQPADLDRALAIAYTNEYSKPLALSALLPYLPAERRPAVAADVLTSSDATLPAASVLSYLAPDQVPLILDLVERGDDENPLAAFLQQAIPLLPDDALPRIEALVFTRPGNRAAVRAALALRKRAGLTDVLADITSNINSWQDTDFQWGVEALCMLVPHMPESHSQVLATAAGISDESQRGYLLQKVALSLDPRLIPDVLAAIGDPHDGVSVLTTLVAHASDSDRPTLIPVALQAFEDAFPASERALADLAPYLSANQLLDALSIAHIGPTQHIIALLARAAELSEHDLFMYILRIVLRSNTRRGCLEIIAACLPTLCDLGGPDLAIGLNESLATVRRWWP